MAIHKYSINNIFKLLLIVGIIFSATNSTLADIERDNTKEESLEAPGLVDAENDPASEDSSVEEETTEPETVLDDGKAKSSNIEQQLEGNNPENLASQEFLTLKNILLLFAIIDLPILALLLVLWFLDRKEQKQRFDRLTSKQNTIDRKLKQLETITSKLENSDKLQNKVVKEIEENKQEIINSRIEILVALNKRQPESPVNSNGRADNSLTKDLNPPSFNKEQTEHQLDKFSHNQVAVIEQIPQFVDKYNFEKKSLSNEVKATVVATQASLDDKRLGKIDKLTLESTAQKKYLVVQEDSDYYLVPHAKINIEEHNIKTLESLFECINFSSDYTDFHLIEPAKVSKLDSELWQLEKKGKLEFS